MAAVPSGAAPGVYKARRPQASPLFRQFAMAVCGAIAVLVSRDAAHIAPAIALAAMTGLAIALDLAVRHGAEIRGILKP